MKTAIIRDSIKISTKNCEKMIEKTSCSLDNFEVRDFCRKM